ncbi:MAG: glycine cleavage system protein GcvH [Bryobacterales bacterium]|nr:glycine cleavage system protein GcvH [Bryobacterales bacterium]MDE0293426.1 glycine cleavage system protein GcvH [Bryobacterales bacterium]MDE0435352.1 glycine cleavage system protein GcvH [Bryobacterales bacterium]
MYPNEFRYTREHEWVSIDGDTATVGITDHAQDQLGDVVFVELPQLGVRTQSMQSFGTVESVKAVSDVYSPLTGQVTEVNETLVDAPEKLNESPHGDGWLIKLQIEDRTEIETLMTAEAYQAYIDAEKES